LFATNLGSSEMCELLFKTTLEPNVLSVETSMQYAQGAYVINLAVWWKREPIVHKGVYSQILFQDCLNPSPNV